MSASKRKGTGWETAIVDYLRSVGATHAERRALNGAKDRGDIAGIPSVVIEAKSAAKVELAAWLDEAVQERDNDGAGVGVVWFKRRGKTNPGQGFVLMDGATLIWLLREAGYLPDVTQRTPADDPPEWAVDHPGLGIYAYPDEDAARIAAGTAGTLLHHGAAVTP